MGLIRRMICDHGMIAYEYTPYNSERLVCSFCRKILCTEEGFKFIRKNKTMLGLKEAADE